MQLQMQMQIQLGVLVSRQHAVAGRRLHACLHAHSPVCRTNVRVGMTDSLMLEHLGRG